MYKLVYREAGMEQELTSNELHPLQQMLRHLFALHNNYKGSTDKFELLFFGKKV
jgi:hypothetical protein